MKNKEREVRNKNRKKQLFSKGKEKKKFRKRNQIRKNEISSAFSERFVSHQLGSIYIVDSLIQCVLDTDKSN